MSHELTIRHELRAGDLGRIISLHGEVYDSIDGFGLRFEAFVAQTLAEYVLQNEARGRIWMAERGGVLVGCTAALLRDDGRGQLRWVVVCPEERGQGLGKQLVVDAIQYCRSANCRSLYLETTDGLVESQTLYESLGFSIASSSITTLWAEPRPLIIMEKRLRSSNFRARLTK